MREVYAKVSLRKREPECSGKTLEDKIAGGTKMNF